MSVVSIYVIRGGLGLIVIGLLGLVVVTVMYLTFLVSFSFVGVLGLDLVWVVWVWGSVCALCCSIVFIWLV